MIDKDLLKKGLKTVSLGVVDSISGAIAVSAPTGFTQIIGAMCLVKGYGEVGIGTALVIAGALSDPSTDNSIEAEQIPTTVPQAIGMTIDNNTNNDSHIYESVAVTTEAVLGLGTIATSEKILNNVLNAVTVLEFGKAASGLVSEVIQSCDNSSSAATEPQFGDDSEFDRDKTQWLEVFNDYLLWTP